MAVKGELEFIRRLAPLLGHESAAAGLPFGDDMAALRAGGQTLLLTTDLISDGVDFESGRHAWQDVGYKAMAVNLSDCAAMAVRPIGAVCALCLSNALSMDDALAIMRGASECGRAFGCPIAGGDTNSWDSPTVVCVTVAALPDGACPPVRRDGARPGDLLCLSGPVGGSLLGRHLRPAPRIDLAIAVNRALRPHAMIDISDGLAIDLWRLLDASGCGAEIDAAALDGMIHADARVLSQRANSSSQPAASPREHALHDGEDFELLIALPADTTAAPLAAHGLTRIGRFVAAAGCRLREPDGRTSQVERRGWEHFR